MIRGGRIRDERRAGSARSRRSRTARGDSMSIVDTSKAETEECGTCGATQVELVDGYCSDECERAATEVGEDENLVDWIQEGRPL